MSSSDLPAYPSTRRFFLRATGVSLALPLLESLGGRIFAQDSAAGTQMSETKEAIVLKRDAALETCHSRNFL